MKKIVLVAALVLSILCFAAVANAGTTLSPEKSSFYPGSNQIVKVYYTTDVPLEEDAWIGAIPEGVPDDEIQASAYYSTYTFTSDDKYSTDGRKYVDLAVPAIEGNYTIRMFTSDTDGVGHQIASVPLYVGMDAPATTDTSATTTPTTGTTTPDTGTTGVQEPAGTGTTGTGAGPVTIINNNTTINQNTNTTNNSADTNTNISGSTIANSNVASNNQTGQTTTNDNSIKVTQYVSVTVNGQPLQSDVKPFVNADGRTMLPIRAIAEALGATVQWDEATQTATLTLGGKTVKVTIGQNSLLVDGQPVSMDTAAAIKDDRTLLPVRAIGEALGAQVGWDEQTQTVKLDK